MSDYFIFGNIDTRDYEGIYVYFDDVDAIPSRVGEFIEIPGRNGSFYLDKGRYEDITHTYDIVALTMEAGRDLINAISSQVGYHRLEDSFNPDEFYSAVFTSEVEPNVPTDREQMTFKLMFTRKPQRFLISGETAIDVDSGDTLTNPTLFEASPLLEVEGYGDISFNGFSIALDPAYIGDVTLLGSSSGQSGVSGSYSSAMLLANDTITLSGATFKWRATATAGQASQVVSATLSFTSRQTTGTPTVSYSAVGTNALDITVKYPQQTFTEGSNTTLTDEGNLVVTYKDSSNVSQTVSLPIRIRIRVDTSNAANSYMSVANYSRTQPSGWRLQAQSVSISSLTGYSTQSVLGNPTYVDCELGEAYKYVDGTPVSLNKYIDLGSILPIFASGSNEITFDNTVTDLKITPNWWKI